MQLSSPPASVKDLLKQPRGTKIDILKYFAGLGLWCLPGPKQPSPSAGEEVETSPAFLPEEHGGETPACWIYKQQGRQLYSFSDLPEEQ